MTSRQHEIGDARAARPRAPARRRPPPRRRSRAPADRGRNARMSALSSASTMREPNVAAKRRSRATGSRIVGCRPVGAGGCRRIVQPAQRLLDERLRAPPPWTRARAAPARDRAADARVPNGMPTRNVVPRPSSLVGRRSCRRAASRAPARAPARCRMPSCVRPCAPSIAVEPLEQPRQLRFGDADARVATLRAAHGPWSRRNRTATPPASVNLKAFERRFSTIFSHISRST